MTITTTKGQESYLPALHGSSTCDSTASTPDLTRAEARALLERVLPRLADESTPEDADDLFYPQSLQVNEALGRKVDRWEVRDALEALNSIGHIQAGNCLVKEYGCPNTDEWRDYHLDAEQQNLTVALQNITAGIPE